MERTKRIIKPVVRLVEDPNFGKPDKPEKEIAKPANKRPARKQPQKPVELPKSPSKTSPNIPNAPAKTKKREGRTLHLDLPDVPPSDDIKLTEDWRMPDNPFWRENFFTPKDNTTQEYMEATDKLIHLPAEFYLVKGIDTAYGVANLELNPNMVRQMKRIPLYS